MSQRTIVKRNPILGEREESNRGIEMEVYLCAEVARKLGCSPQWVRQLAELHGDEMGAFRLTVGGHWRFRSKVFDKWINRQGPKITEVDVRTKQVSCR